MQKSNTKDDEVNSTKRVRQLEMEILLLKDAYFQLKKTKNELEKSKAALVKKVVELEKFINLTVGRELKMIELKKTVKELEEKLIMKKD
ncbi:hypothetical protein KKA13_01370 [Patescibacteria group bacterium]|nr:hypothetical protein [Patescibacteria group bacterium]MBU1613312.1 hypothetical protein [Patescibacteria group bacterium]